MIFPLLIGGLVLSPSFKEQESYVVQEMRKMEELDCSDFGATGTASLWGLGKCLCPREGLSCLLIQTGQALTTSFLLYRLICALQKSKLGLGGQMRFQRQGWEKRSPTLYLSLGETFPVSQAPRLFFTFSRSK